jgi:hypothetical protein
MQTLHLGREQAPAILEALAEVSKRQDELGTWAASQQAAATGTAQQVADFLGRRRVPPPQLGAQGRALYEAWAQHRDAVRQAADAAAMQIVQIAKLTADVVEPKEAADETARLERLFDGAHSPAEFIVDDAEALRMLEDEDYRLMRRVESQRIAERITGNRSAATARLADRIMGALDALRDLPDQDFDSGRALLIQQVSQNLNLPGPQTPTPPVTWRQLVEWAATPETASLMAALSGQAAPKITPVPQAVTDAMAELRMLGFILGVQPGPQQMGALGQLLAAAGTDKQAVQARADQAAQEAAEALPKTIDAVSKGQAVPADVADKVQQALADGDGADGMMKAAMSTHINGLRRILTGPQREMIDWRPTGGAEKIPPEERARVLEAEAGVIGEALDALNTIKFAAGWKYKNLKVQFTEPLVARYIDPRSPDYEDAVRFALDLVRDARYVKQADWYAGADVEFATRLMRRLGGLQEEPDATREGPPAMYDWQDVYEILSGTAGTPLAAALAGGQQ